MEEIILACLEVNPLHRARVGGRSSGGAGRRRSSCRNSCRWDVRRRPRYLPRLPIVNRCGSGQPRFLLAGIFGGLAGFVVVAESTTSSFGIPLARSPEVLAYEASTKIRRLGYTEIPADTAYGFFQLRDDARRSGSRNFWYRQSPAPMEVLGFRTPASVGYFDPPGRSPGMIGMTLDGSGSVRSFYAVPTQKLRPVGAPLDTQAAWRMLFEQAGLDIASFSEVQPQSISPVAFDTQRAWAGTVVRQASEGRSRVVARPAGVPGHCCGSDEAEPVPQQPVSTGIERSQDHHHPDICLERSCRSASGPVPCCDA